MDALTDYVAIVGTWLVAVLGNVDHFTKNIIHIWKFRIAEWCITAVIVVAITILAVAAVLKQRQLTQLKQLTPFADMERITEASGVAAVGGQAYVVSDEPEQGVVELVWSNDHYDNLRQCTLVDDKGDKFTAPNDLEAVAAIPDTSDLLLLTSHSNNKDGEDKPRRRQLVEVSTTQDRTKPCVLRRKRATDLRPAMLRALAHNPEFKTASDDIAQCATKVPTGCGYVNEVGNAEVFQIEGISVVGRGDERRVYIGMRAPLLQKKAIVFTAPYVELFSDQLSLQPVYLALHRGGKYYGISSLDFDTHSPTGRMILLGNASSHAEVLPPVVCTWSLRAEDQPDCKALPRFADYVWARPESLVFPTEDKVLVFLDGDNRAYGQAVYSRSELGL